MSDQGPAGVGDGESRDDAQFDEAGGHPRGGRKRIVIVAGAVALVVLPLLVLVLVKVIGRDSAESVAERYLRAEFEDDQALACELSTRTFRDIIVESFDVEDCADVFEKVGHRSAAAEDEFVAEYEESREAVLSDTEIEIEINEVEEDDDRAKVWYEATRKYSGDNDDYVDAELDGVRRKDYVGMLHLCKEDGAWKVDPHNDVEDLGFVSEDMPESFYCQDPE